MSIGIKLLVIVLMIDKITKLVLRKDATIREDNDLTDYENDEILLGKQGSSPLLMFQINTYYGP